MHLLFHTKLLEDKRTDLVSLTENDIVLNVLQMEDYQVTVD